MVYIEFIKTQRVLKLITYRTVLSFLRDVEGYLLVMLKIQPVP